MERGNIAQLRELVETTYSTLGAFGMGLAPNQERHGLSWYGVWELDSLTLPRTRYVHIRGRETYCVAG